MTNINQAQEHEARHTIGRVVAMEMQAMEYIIVHTAERYDDTGVAIYSYPGVRDSAGDLTDQHLQQFGPANMEPLTMPGPPHQILGYVDRVMEQFMISQLPPDYQRVTNPNPHLTHPWHGVNLPSRELQKLTALISADPYGPYYVAGWDTTAPKPKMTRVAGITITNPAGHIGLGGHTWNKMVLLETYMQDPTIWHIIYITPNKRFAHINRVPLQPDNPRVHILLNGDPTAFFAVNQKGQVLPIKAVALSNVNHRYHQTVANGQPIGFPRI